MLFSFFFLFFSFCFFFFVPSAIVGVAFICPKGTRMQENVATPKPCGRKLKQDGSSVYDPCCLHGDFYLSLQCCLMERGATILDSKGHSQNKAFVSICISWETLKHFPLHMHIKIASVLLPALRYSRLVKSCIPETSESPSWTLNSIVISSIVYSTKTSYSHSDTYF